MISPGKRSFDSLPPTPSALHTPNATPVAAKLDETVTAFLLDRRIAGATTTTTATYRIQLQAFLNWCREHGLDLTDLTIDALRTYLASRQQRSQSALFEAVRRLKTFFRWCAKEGISDDLGTRIRRPKQEQKVIPSLSVGQVRAMLALCSRDAFLGRRDEALLRLLVDCGLRISEALALVPGDVDFEGARIIVRHGKGQKQRIVPVGPRTLKALLKYSSVRSQRKLGTEVLFVATNSRPLTRRHVEQHLKRLAYRAGIENVRVSPHTLRHTCALSNKAA